MKFCPNINSRDFYKWNHGFNPCFIETVSGSSIFLFIYIFGLLQIRAYKKYSVPLEYWQRPNTFCFNFQVVLICFISSLSLLRVVIQNTISTTFSSFLFHGEMAENKFYYYTLIVGFLYFASWMMCLYLIFLERKRALPGLPARGHGLTLIVFWALCLIWENLSFLNWWHEKWFWNIRNFSDKLEVALFSMRYICTTILFLIGIKAPALFSIPLYIQRHIFHNQNVNDRGNLLSDPWYVSIQRKNNGRPNQSTETSNNINPSTWNNLKLKMKLFGPFLWPKGQPMLQFKLFLCVLIILAGRVLNVLLPITYKSLINKLTNREFCWKTILLFVFLQFLQGFGVGGTGLLSNLRSFLWISIQQYSTKKFQVEIYTHILSLSLDWHVKKKTGEILRVLDRGTQSINNLLNYVSFQVGPTLLDILVAIIFLMISFGIWYSLIIILTMALYIASTILITEWRTKHRRRMNQMDNAVSSRATETLFNFETVKYSAGEWFEIGQYDRMIQNYQKEEWITSSSLNGLNIIQGLICVCIGLLGGALLCARQIVYPSVAFSLKPLTVGDFVLYISYLAQLYIPLNWFGTFYRSIQQSLIDMENMIDLMRQPSFDSPKSILRTSLSHISHLNRPANMQGAQTSNFLGSRINSQVVDFIKPNDNLTYVPMGDECDDINKESPANYPPLIVSQGLVEFKHVYFAYPKATSNTSPLNPENATIVQGEPLQGPSSASNIGPGEQLLNSEYVLKDISFTVGPGAALRTPSITHFSDFEFDSSNSEGRKIPRIIGIVGPSGSGKTTLMKLLFKLYNPTRGIITIDGQDVTKVDPISLRRQLGLVAQDSILFNQSVAYNIDYGTFSLPPPSASKTGSPLHTNNSNNEDNINEDQKTDNVNDQIKNAAIAAQIHDSIMGFPNGYDTLVGERGLRLSGGEKQRIAIARLVMKSPKIILLDEATSSLDTANEAAIQNNLNQMFNFEKRATMIIVAHRLSTVVNADEILVMEKGQIVERGSHEELLLRNGVYSTMWHKQLRKKDEPAKENL